MKQISDIQYKSNLFNVNNTKCSILDLFHLVLSKSNEIINLTTYYYYIEKHGRWHKRYVLTVVLRILSLLQPQLTYHFQHNLKEYLKLILYCLILLILLYIIYHFFLCVDRYNSLFHIGNYQIGNYAKKPAQKVFIIFVTLF